MWCAPVSTTVSFSIPATPIWPNELLCMTSFFKGPSQESKQEDDLTSSLSNILSFVE